MGDYQAKSVGLRTSEPGYLHPGMAVHGGRDLTDAPSERAESRVSSEYNRHNRKSRVPGTSKRATPPRAFGNDGGPPPGQPFRHTQVHFSAELSSCARLLANPPPLTRRRPLCCALCWCAPQSAIAEEEMVHGWLPAVTSPRDSAQYVHARVLCVVSTSSHSPDSTHAPPSS